MKATKANARKSLSEVCRFLPQEVQASEHIEVLSDFLMKSPDVIENRDDVLQELFESICFLAFKHEVQYWKDAPGTDAEKLADIVNLARKGLALVKGKIQPEHV